MRARIIALIASILSILALISPGNANAGSDLRIGTNIWPGYEPLYLADQLGYFSEGSIDLVEYLSASEVLRAFRNGSIEAAALTLDEVLILAENDIPTSVILVTDISSGGDAIVAKPAIETFADLSGHRVGVEGSALGAYVLSRALDIHGVGVDSIQIVQLEVSEHEAAFNTGAVDAVVTFEPVRSKLLSAGGKEIFTSLEIPGEIVDVLVVRTDHLDARAKNLTAVMRGWFKALDYLREHPNDAAERMSPRLGLAPSDVLASYDGLTLPSLAENLKLLGGPSPGLEKPLQQLENLMLEQGLLSTKVSLDNLLTASILQQSFP